MRGSKLFVGNLNYSVTSEDLADLFSNHGKVKDAKVIEGKGFGFVEMGSLSEAENAKEALNGTEFAGRSLNEDEVRPPKSRNQRRGGGGGYRRY